MLLDINLSNSVKIAWFRGSGSQTNFTMPLSFTSTSTFTVLKTRKYYTTNTTTNAVICGVCVQIVDISHIKFKATDADNVYFFQAIGY